MKHVLILGAGQSAPYCIDYLLRHAKDGNWFVSVADRDPKLAQRRVQNHPRGNAVAIDVADHALLVSHIRKADVVVNLLAPRFQSQIAYVCVEHGKHMISASYRDQTVRDLHRDAQRSGVLILCEIGLDPGIDHMSAMSMIDRVRSRGRSVTSFISYGSGIPAPDSLSTPLKYAITWNPRNVVMAGENGAQYLRDDQIKLVPYSGVFQRSWVVEVDGLGTMEAFPNRDALSYRAIYGLEHVHTMVRGTLRYPGWSETWLQIVRLGLPNETLRIPGLPQRTYAELIEMCLPRSVVGDSLEQRIAHYLNISPTGAIMDKLRWLGLFDDTPIGCEGDTSADALIHVLKQKLALQPGERDMVVLVHELETAAAHAEAASERVTSTLIAYGEPNGFTAMSRAVGLPVAIAAELLLNDELPLTGSYIPTHPAIYTPILQALAQAGLAFQENVVRIGE